MRAFLRLTLITVLATLAIVLGLFTLGRMGAMQGYGKPHHPWSERGFLLVQKQSCTVDELKKNHETQPRAIHAIQVSVDPLSSQWIVECEHNYPLRELLEGLPSLSYLFDIKAKSDFGFDALIKDLSLLNDNPSIGFRSPSHIVIKKLRKEFPQWLFAADATTLVKIHLFESLHIESLADIWPDLFITHGDRRTAEFLTPRLLNELKRRNKIIIWDDTPKNEAIPAAIYPQLSGILTTRPTWAVQEFQSRF